MLWARLSCCSRRAGGLTSFDEYSTAGSELSLLFCVADVDWCAGSWVRSMDYLGSAHRIVEVGSSTYGEHPPPVLKLVQDYARLLRVYRIYGGSFGEAPSIVLALQLEPSWGVT